MENDQFGTLGPANADIQSLINQVKKKVQENIGPGWEPNIYNAVSVRTKRLVGGTNWLVKVNVGNDFIHLLINRVEGVKVPEPLQLVRLQRGHLADDPLSPFEGKL